MEIKNLVHCVFGSFVGGPDKFILSGTFSCSIEGKGSFLCGCCFIFFVGCCFLSNVNLKLV